MDAGSDITRTTVGWVDLHNDEPWQSLSQAVRTEMQS